MYLTHKLVKGSGFFFQTNNIASNLAKFTSITTDISNMDTTLVSFQKQNYMTLEIKPCGFDSRIRDVSS